MGYTHYWYRPEELDQDRYNVLVEDMHTFLSKLPRRSLSAGGYYPDDPVIIRGPQGRGEPVITNDLISFNGDNETSDDLAHETMYFPRILKPESWQSPDPEENNGYFQFCKTAEKPYDIVVCAALLAVKYHFPEINVRSDGKPDEWFVAVAWYLDCVGNRPLRNGPWNEE